MRMRPGISVLKAHIRHRETAHDGLLAKGYESRAARVTVEREVCNNSY